ncbi:MAG TPA: DUF3482 domain-containing protein [Ramlibacter sp.]|nr:DUF3482 domain-containing protein [Ramlibacter sp.]
MDDSTLRLDEASARQLVLVRAIEDVDTQGKLLSEIEREQLERDALEASRRASPAAGLDRAQYLQHRARKLLAAVENRHPQLAALQDPEPWRRWLLWVLPLAAMALGAAIDRIDNPERVNMLSPPLLGVLFWNLAMYLFLLFSAFAPAAWQLHGPLSALQRWFAGVPVHGRRTGRLRLDVSARFHQQWLQATGRQQWLWAKQLLHLSAAGWALGLGISIVIGGLVRQYRIGWESTLLDPPQVHAFLTTLFAPVVALLPVPGFSADDVQRLRFGSGAAIGLEEARRWVWMYLALLGLVVAVPRVLLAAWAAWRRRQLGRAVRIDLRDPYFVEVLARVSPARVTLGMLAPTGPARDLLLRLLDEAADRPSSGSLREPNLRPAPGPRTVLTTGKGDVLRQFEIPLAFQPPAPVASAAAGANPAQAWLQDLLGRFRPATRRPASRDEEVQAALADTDLVLLVASRAADLVAATRLLHWVAQPALVLVDTRSGAAEAIAACRLEAQRLGLVVDVLDLDGVGRHWLREPPLREALAARLAPSKRAGFARVAQAWGERHEGRFHEAMLALAGLLVQAAREAEDLGGAPGSLRHLLDAGEREAWQRAREAASAVLFERLRSHETATFAEVLRLYRLAAPAAPVEAARLEDGLVLQQAVDTPQAGMAGAATGAAMGAGIDLITGGLTLGAAAALGAVIGGGAAYVAAAWKNRTAAPSGQSQVQPSDELLQTLTESALLGYLRVAHRAPEPAGLPAAWRSEVVAAVAARRHELATLWAQARTDREEAVELRLAGELEGVMRGVLRRV